MREREREGARGRQRIPLKASCRQKKIDKKIIFLTKHIKFNALPCYGEDKAVKCLT